MISNQTPNCSEAHYLLKAQLQVIQLGLLRDTTIPIPTYELFYKTPYRTFFQLFTIFGTLERARKCSRPSSVAFCSHFPVWLSISLSESIIEALTWETASGNEGDGEQSKSVESAGENCNWKNSPGAQGAHSRCSSRAPGIRLR